MSERNKTTLKAIYEALAEGDVDTVLAQFADDIRFHVSGRSTVSGDYSGKEGVLGFITKLMELSGGTFRLEVLDMLANDKHGVVLTMETASADGRELKNQAVHVWEMSDAICQVFRGYNQNAWDEFWPI